MRCAGQARGRLWRRALSFLFPVAVALFLLWREPVGYALFLLAAVLVHEAGHLFAFLALGEPPPLLTGRAGGLLLSPRGQVLSYGRELIVAAAGPLFNILTALALIPALHGGRGEASFCFFALNLLSALFNLLPIAGFDGGRVLFCLTSLLLPSRLSRGICDVFSVVFLLFFYFSALFLFLFESGGEYSFLLSLFLLYKEGVRVGAFGGDFVSNREKNGGFARKERMAGAGAR